jgi:hypothetical protein
VVAVTLVTRSRRTPRCSRTAGPASSRGRSTRSGKLEPRRPIDILRRRRLLDARLAAALIAVAVARQLPRAH